MWKKKRNGSTNEGICTAVVRAHMGADKKAGPRRTSSSPSSLLAGLQFFTLLILWISFHRTVSSGSKWRAGTRETEVRLGGWCEGGLGQQRNDCGGCASIRERSERVESTGTYVTEWVSRCHYCLALCSFEPPSRALVVITWIGVAGMPLIDAVGINCKKWLNYLISRRRCQVCGLSGVCWWLCVCYPTWHDYYHSLVEGESHGI